MKKISVIIPVYKEGRVKEIVKKVMSDNYKNKEVVIVADCPSDKLKKDIEDIKRKFSNIKIDISYTRRGKVDAINYVCKKLKSDIFLFIDADMDVVKLSLNRIATLLEDYDIVDFIKPYKPTKYFHYLIHSETIFNILFSLLSARLRKGLVFGGNAFAVKREIWEKVNGYSKKILEDFDFLTKVYLAGGKYTVDRESLIFIGMPDSISKFIDQRRRWFIGTLEYIKSHYRSIIKFVKEHWKPLLLFFLLMNMPTIGYISLFLFKANIVEKIVISILTILLSRLYLLLLVAPISYLYLVFSSILSFLLMTSLSVFSYYLLHRMVNYKFNLILVLQFILITIPILLVLYTAFLFEYLIRKNVNIDWKV